MFGIVRISTGKLSLGASSPDDGVDNACRFRPTRSKPHPEGLRIRELGQPTARRNCRPAMLTVPLYGCASRTALAPLATVFRAPQGLVFKPDIEVLVCSLATVWLTDFARPGFVCTPHNPGLLQLKLQAMRHSACRSTPPRPVAAVTLCVAAPCEKAYPPSTSLPAYIPLYFSPPCAQRKVALERPPGRGVNKNETHVV